MEDKDPVTKKKFWFITPKQQEKKRLLIPQRWKDYFCNKTITISKRVKLFHISFEDSMEVKVNTTALHRCKNGKYSKGCNSECLSRQLVSPTNFYCYFQSANPIF